MIRKFLATVTLVCGPSIACAQISAQVVCSTNNDFGLIATLMINGAPSSEHFGVPGVVYVGLAEKQGDTVARAFALGENGVFQPWDGSGFLPITQVFRNGLQSFSYRADVTAYVGDPTLSLWVGYGVLTAEREAQVQRAKQAIVRAQALRPNANIVDVGDDWRRRAAVDDDVRRNGRYQQVLQRLQCS